MVPFCPWYPHFQRRPVAYAIYTGSRRWKWVLHGRKSIRERSRRMYRSDLDRILARAFVKKPGLVYSEDYFMDLGLGHVFPAEKYSMAFQVLKKKGSVNSFHLLAPESATREMLLLAHSAPYVDALLALELTPMTQYSELPLNKVIVDAFCLAAGGTILAAREALKEGSAANIGGGFHHASADRAEGFCYLNDLAIAIRVLQQEKKIKKAAVIDCDLHQGNGTAKIFFQDPTVYTFSIHQEDNYPPKEESSWDIGLPDFTGDEEYLQHLALAVPKILDSFNPDLVLYQAGADPYMDDRLGQLSITKEGLQKRDRLVYAECRKRKIPVAVTLGGGYAEQVHDTVDIHCNSLEALL